MSLLCKLYLFDILNRGLIQFLCAYSLCKMILSKIKNLLCPLIEILTSVVRMDFKVFFTDISLVTFKYQLVIYFNAIILKAREKCLSSINIRAM